MNTPVRWVAGLLSVAVLASAVALIGLAAANAPQPAWFLILFELAVAVSAGMGGLAALCRFRSSPAMALACAAGTILIGSVMSDASSRAGFSLFDLRLATYARVIGAGLLGLAAAWAVLGCNPRCTLRPLALGIVLSAAAAGITVAAWMTWGRIGALPVAVGVFLAVTTLLSAGVHLIMRAFEVAGRASPR